ncbi:MAG: GAF domain-containing protein [Flavobacterium sp.]|nr:GAF domain-containing protein [Flavobacterium sp.]
MSEELKIVQKGTKEDKYIALMPQIAALVESESHLIANLANVTAALKQQFDWLWVGFYQVKFDQLILGPFQGPIACTRINKGQGVCGKSWAASKTIIVPDVSKFVGHIACSSNSKSEIVIPILVHGYVVAVLDVDSDKLDDFDIVDQTYLEQIIALLKFK